MRRRTPSEIKAYGDGYADAYKQFCHLLKKTDKDKAIRKMEIFAKGVEITVETAMDEPNSSEKPNNCEDEPQYEMGMGTLKCDNCSEYGSFKCTKCDGEMYFTRLEPKDEPQTSGVVWTEDAIKKEPKSYTTWASTDEPQTDVWEYHNGEWTEPQTEQGKCPFDDEIPCEWVNCPNSKTDCAWK